ncbi:hypothetical protein Pan258_60790 [Symmachiella dynata]|nr:hypothetical protein Pan258_60790 [Symmachiella dynata]
MTLSPQCPVDGWYVAAKFWFCQLITAVRSTEIEHGCLVRPCPTGTASCPINVLIKHQSSVTPFLVMPHARHQTAAYHPPFFDWFLGGVHHGGTEGTE